MAKASTNVKRLPSAPLAEVVFERRWTLQSFPNLPPQLAQDPGLLPTIEPFTKEMKRIGFGTFKDLVPIGQIAAHSVARRFFKEPASPFPLMQIGPGVFASNESQAYDWGEFKKQVLKGVSALVKTYPSERAFRLTPSHMELRYIDVFDKSLLGHVELFQFLHDGTAMDVKLPATLLDDKTFAADPVGRVLIQRDFKKRAGARFTLDVASGNREGEDIVRMESKVISTSNLPALKSGPKFLKDVEAWLEFAHDFTSPFFKTFVKKSIMDKFKAKKKA